MSVQRDIVDGGKPATCRVCGCTDDAACWPTCWWVEPDLCSRCAAKGRPVRA